MTVTEVGNANEDMHLIMPANMRHIRVCNRWEVTECDDPRLSFKMWP